MNRIVGLLLLAALLLFAGCVHNGAGTKAQASSAANVEYHEISAQQLKTMLGQGANIFLIDVNVPVQKRIPDTDAIIPYNHIKQYAYKLPKDRSTKIVVYDMMGGPMSFPAIESLYELGYKNVYYLEGGTDAWPHGYYAVLDRAYHNIGI